MKSIEEMSYFPTSEKLVDVLCQKTQNPNRLFFRILVAYYFSKIASMQRVDIKTLDRGDLPVNMYAINLATSGYGKGFSTNILEEQVINQFRERFLQETMPLVSEGNLLKIANERAAKKDADPDEELVRVRKEYDAAGELAFSFDSGTTAAVKQMRHKLLMANAGSLNMEIDEAGSNLLGNVEVLTTYLELFDVGKVKQKLTKNTNENTRATEIDGRTPTNMMLFGTPSKLLDGGKVEDEFISMLETGYGRRCLFGYTLAGKNTSEQTAEEIFELLTDTGSNGFIEDLSDELGELADPVHFEKRLTISRDTSILLIQYKLDCEKHAATLSEHQPILKAELEHRYFKVLKLAGTYAFIDHSSEVTEAHIYNAIKLVEDSGESFGLMMQRDRPYVKVAKYLSTMTREITHVDLMEDLPCYKGGEHVRREMITHAIAWGHRNNVIIKKSMTDGIEFIKGESLNEVDLENMRFSASTQLGENYDNVDTAVFSQLQNLTQQPSMHWTTHHLNEGIRRESSVISGCDMVVIDVDEGISIGMAQLLLKDMAYHMHTTKSHGRKIPDKNPKGEDRFRIILPLSHRVKLDAEDFKEFMQNIYAWLPFNSDEATNQRSRKWMTCKDKFWNNEGATLNALLFIPKTRKAEEQAEHNSELGNLTNIERWFIAETKAGNRSNNLIRYGLMLVDANMDFESIKNNILALNGKLASPLSETEILGTIMISVNKAISQKE